MSEEAAFLAAIQAAPDDDTLRLVYADWLEERNDPRSEYLRLDVEISQNLRDARTVPRASLDRHLELQDAFDLNWVVIVTGARPSPPHIRPWVWRLLESSNRSLRILCQQLEALSEEQLRRFYDQIGEAKDYINPCYVEKYHPYLTGGCSEDHGDDFSAWVVMEGRDFYEQVLNNPDQIMRFLPMYDDALRNWQRKRKRRGSPTFWDCEIDRVEYRGHHRVDYLARRIYEVRFGRAPDF